MIDFTLDGRRVEVPDDGTTLLDALREHLGVRSVKDGCSPQGQCGCCTVWIDGAPRVSCVTPARRVAGRAVTTVDGLDPAVRDRWAEALAGHGGSQCGFCTPGILMRLAAHDARPGRVDDEAALRTALLAHLCRCTGWQTIVEAALDVAAAPAAPAAPTAPLAAQRRDPLLAAWRAQLEGPAFQTADAATALGRAGFADDTAPPGALVAVPDPAHPEGYATAPTLAEARRATAKVQGRNSTVALTHPLELPEGEWALTLRTTWVEPAYLEPDASWCRPGALPATPLANGGAFGGKRRSPVPADARRLADAHGAPVRVLWSREDVVRRGPKRPPVAIGVRADGTGVLRFARCATDEETDAYVARVAAVAPGLAVEPVRVLGPPTSPDLRGAGWAEALAVLAVLGARAAGTAGPGTPVEVRVPGGGRARVAVATDGAVSVEVWCGEVLDEVTLRSYCVGAVHQALGWVWREGVAVGPDGAVLDLTIRSFGVLSARDTPRMDLTLHDADTWPVNGSDAVFAATAAAAWLTEGGTATWPTRRGAAR